MHSADWSTLISGVKQINSLGKVPVSFYHSQAMAFYVFSVQHNMNYYINNNICFNVSVSALVEHYN